MQTDQDNRAGHRQVTGVVLPLVLACVFALLVGRSWFLGSNVGMASAPYWVFLGLLMRGSALGGVAPKPSPGASSNEKNPSRRIELGQIARRLQHPSVRRVWLACVVLVLAAAGYFTLGALESPAPNMAAELSLVGVLIAVAFGSSVLAGYYHQTPLAELPDATGLANAARIGFWIAVLAGGAALLRAIGEARFELETSIVFLAIPALLSVELLVRVLVRSMLGRASGEGFGADLLISRFLGSSLNPLQSLFIGIERTFGVDVRSSWALTFSRRAAPIVVLSLAGLAWLLSSVVVVDASQQAVRERFGRALKDQVLEPGIHLGLPWPLDRVRLVDVRRVREVPIGYVEAKAGADALWTKLHAAEEFNLLLGDGRDLITVNAELQYRIGDVHEWLYGTQNPSTALETLSYQVLMDATVNESLAGVLSSDIGDFSTRMVEAIQTRSDLHRLGIEVVSFNLRGLHPPVAVATDYQAVVAAQIEQGTRTMQAQAFRYDALPTAEAEAVLATRGADAFRAERLSQARGEASAFKALEAQYETNPKLYRFRRHLETVEDVLVGHPHYVIDSRIERDGGAVWILD